MSFRVLSLSDNEERQKWLTCWEAWPEHDPMAHPAYVEAFLNAGERGVCCHYEDEAGSVLMPIIVRQLVELPWSQTSGLCDLSTPYGYGGPLRMGNPNVEGFWDGFDAWSRSLDAVSFVARLSLFPEELLPFRGETAAAMSNVVRTLKLSEQEMLMDYEHKVRKNIKKALRSGLTTEVDLRGERLDDFLRIYEETMARRGAEKSFYFSKPQLEKLLLEMPGSCAFFHVLLDDKVISTEFVLVGASHMYSFLGGTDEAFYEFRPNDLLKHSIIQWGRAQSKQALVLGGGYGADDGIYRYKLSFAPKGARPFLIGKRVLDDQAYGHLCDLRRDYGDWAPREGYFPAYRG